MSQLNSKSAINERTIPHIRHNRNCVFLMHIHLVFVTKYRRNVLTVEMLNRLHEVYASICQKFDAILVEFNGEEDHVHLLINYPPKVSISSFVNSLKGVSSRYLQKEFTSEIRKKLWKGHLWSPSYFAGSCGGAPLKVLREYIENQRRE
ncbi:MAG: IS200/IS605 family transposase [Oligoflexia bacterium]|nr:IS200/IS605 family transposase [Oligoflexia bacterium]